MAPPRRTSKGSKTTGDWASTAKAIAIRAIDRGQLVHLGIITITCLVVNKISSPDWVEIARLAFSSGYFAAVGWTGFIGATLASAYILKAQRDLYRSEMDRVCEERNELQKLINGGVQSSNPDLPDEET